MTSEFPKPPDDREPSARRALAAIGAGAAATLGWWASHAAFGLPPPGVVGGLLLGVTVCLAVAYGPGMLRGRATRGRGISASPSDRRAAEAVILPGEADTSVAFLASEVAVFGLLAAGMAWIAAWGFVTGLLPGEQIGGAAVLATMFGGIALVEVGKLRRRLTVGRILRARATAATERSEVPTERA